MSGTALTQGELGAGSSGAAARERLKTYSRDRDRAGSDDSTNMQVDSVVVPNPQASIVSRSDRATARSKQNLPETVGSVPVASESRDSSPPSVASSATSAVTQRAANHSDSQRAPPREASAFSTATWVLGGGAGAITRAPPRLVTDFLGVPAGATSLRRQQPMAFLTGQAQQQTAAVQPSTSSSATGQAWSVQEAGHGRPLPPAQLGASASSEAGRKGGYVGESWGPYGPPSRYPWHYDQRDARQDARHGLRVDVDSRRTGRERDVWRGDLDFRRDYRNSERGWAATSRERVAEAEMSVDFRRDSRGDNSGYAAGRHTGVPADVDYRRDVGAGRNSRGAARTKDGDRRRSREVLDKSYDRQAESNRTLALGGAYDPAPAPRRVKRESSTGQEAQAAEGQRPDEIDETELKRKTGRGQKVADGASIYLPLSKPLKHCSPFPLSSRSSTQYARLVDTLLRGAKENDRRCMTYLLVRGPTLHHIVWCTLGYFASRNSNEVGKLLDAIAWNNTGLDNFARAMLNLVRSGIVPKSESRPFSSLAGIKYKVGQLARSSIWQCMRRNLLKHLRSSAKLPNIVLLHRAAQNTALIGRNGPSGRFKPNGGAGEASISPASSNKTGASHDGAGDAGSKPALDATTSSRGRGSSKYAAVAALKLGADLEVKDSRSSPGDESASQAGSVADFYLVDASDSADVSAEASGDVDEFSRIVASAAGRGSREEVLVRSFRGAAAASRGKPAAHEAQSGSPSALAADFKQRPDQGSRYNGTCLSAEGETDKLYPKKDAPSAAAEGLLGDGAQKGTRPAKEARPVANKKSEHEAESPRAKSRIATAEMAVVAERYRAMVAEARARAAKIVADQRVLQARTYAAVYLELARLKQEKDKEEYKDQGKRKYKKQAQENQQKHQREKRQKEEYQVQLEGERKSSRKKRKKRSGTAESNERPERSSDGNHGSVSSKHGGSSSNTAQRKEPTRRNASPPTPTSSLAALSPSKQFEAAIYARISCPVPFTEVEKARMMVLLFQQPVALRHIVRAGTSYLHSMTEEASADAYLRSSSAASTSGSTPATASSSSLSTQRVGSTIQAAEPSQPRIPSAAAYSSASQSMGTQGGARASIPADQLPQKRKRQTSSMQTGLEHDTTPVAANRNRTVPVLTSPTSDEDKPILPLHAKQQVSRSDARARLRTRQRASASSASDDVASESASELRVRQRSQARSGSPEQKRRRKTASEAAKKSAYKSASPSLRRIAVAASEPDSSSSESDSSSDDDVDIVSIPDTDSDDSDGEDADSSKGSSARLAPVVRLTRSQVGQDDMFASLADTDTGLQLKTSSGSSLGHATAPLLKAFKPFVPASKFWLEKTCLGILGLTKVATKDICLAQADFLLRVVCGRDKETVQTSSGSKIVLDKQSRRFVASSTANLIARQVARAMARIRKFDVGGADSAGSSSSSSSAPNKEGASHRSSTPQRAGSGNDRASQGQRSASRSSASSRRSATGGAGADSSASARRRPPRRAAAVASTAARNEAVTGSGAGKDKSEASSPSSRSSASVSLAPGRVRARDRPSSASGAISAEEAKSPMFNDDISQYDRSGFGAAPRLPGGSAGDSVRVTYQKVKKRGSKKKGKRTDEQVPTAPIQQEALMATWAPGTAYSSHEDSFEV